MNDHREITVLVADDHPGMLDVTSRRLEGQGMKTVGKARDGIEALEQIERLQPSVAVLDLRMPGLNGIEVARKAQRSAPDTAIIIYTGFADQAFLNEALDSGVKGFLNKEGPLEDLPRAALAVAQGGTYIDPVLAGVLVATPTSTAPQLSNASAKTCCRCCCCSPSASLDSC